MTGTDLVPTRETTDLATQMEFARAVSSGSILPKAYRDDPGAVLVAINLGSSMGLSPAESLYRIHVIDGKPSASAELIASNVRRAGHRLRIRASNETATAQIIRSDDPDFTYEVTWTIEDAQRAKLAGKDNWTKHPRAMLRARAISECAREACPEALYGVTYIDGEVIEATVHDATVERESAADALAPQAETEPTDGITSQQLKKIGALMREADITDRNVALTYVSDVIGREIGSRNELSKDEASKVIDALEAEKSADRTTGEINPPDNPGFKDQP
jgi:hypothetical protein